MGAAVFDSFEFLHVSGREDDICTMKIELVGEVFSDS